MSNATLGELFAEAAKVAARLEHIKGKYMESDKNHTVTGADAMGCVKIAMETVKVATNDSKIMRIMEDMLGTTAGAWNDKGTTTKEHVIAFFEKASVVYQNIG